MNRACFSAILVSAVNWLVMPLPASAVQVFAISESGYLLNFDSEEPDFVNEVGLVSGLGANETIVGIDFRPADGLLYAATNGNNLFTLNTSTAASTLVQGVTPAFTGTRSGFDFNPVADRLRILNDAEQNLRCSPNPGSSACTVDGALAFGAGDTNFGKNPNIVGAAYTNNVVAPASTALYGIDATLNALVLQSPPNDGTLITVGSLGIDTTDLVGFDIFTLGGINRAYASLTQQGSFMSRFYSIDLATGVASPVGGDDFTSVIGYPDQIRALAITAVPAPAAVWLLATGLAVLGWRRQRRDK